MQSIEAQWKEERAEALELLNHLIRRGEVIIWDSADAVVYSNHEIHEATMNGPAIQINLKKDT